MQKAVTLIEMIVVIGIIGILTGTAIPVLSHYAPGIQLNGSARTLSSNLREAQERTITEQKVYLIRFYPGASASYKMFRIENAVEEEIKHVQLPSGENITLAPTVTNNQIAFSADGGPSSSGDITLTISSVNKVINVSPAGFIKIIA